jgi:hypothetical protein
MVEGSLLGGVLERLPVERMTDSAFAIPCLRLET